MSETELAWEHIDNEDGFRKVLLNYITSKLGEKIKGYKDG